MRYWSCSKFADWLRGEPKPNSASLEEWAKWEEKAKKRRFRYWLADDGLDYLQAFIFWPVTKIKQFRFYISNRFFSKTHALTSKLKRGEWHDFDKRLLFCCFDELINFVEVELAAQEKLMKEEGLRGKFSVFFSRAPDAGIDHLNWASTLRHGDDDLVEKTDPKYGTLTGQALAAKETLALYNWWKFERPNRRDPMEENEDGDEKKDSERIWKIEDAYRKEDESMLIRLIKIRKYLWT